MASSDNLRTLVQEVLSRFNGHTPGSECGKTNVGGDGGKGFALSPEQVLVIAGILGNVLFVDSVLVDKRQNIEIVLTGTLKQKTQMDKLMDQIGSMPFDNVVKAFMERL